MTETLTKDRSAWAEANQRYLSAALEVVRARLEETEEPGRGHLSAALEELERARAELPSPAALEIVVRTFGLSPFERDVLLLAAGVELDASFAARAAKVTFGRALAVFPEAHWSALSPGGALRRWRLVEVNPGPSLADSPVRIDERILHYLTGVQYLDERLAGFLEPVASAPELVPSHRELAAELAAIWAQSEPPLPILHLTGGDPATRRAVVAAAAGALGLGLYALAAALIPTAPDELDGMTRLWERESALSQTALCVEMEDLTGEDLVREAALARLIDAVRGPIFLIGGERRPPRHRPLLAFDVEPPTPEEQRRLWQEVLRSTGAELNGQVDALVGQFRLTPGALRAAGARALTRTDGQPSEGGRVPSDFGARLWIAAREQARPRLDGLAQRLEPRASWDDLVLPEAQRASLRELAIHVRRRLQVYESWGFSARSRRGLGVSALFSGLSGTGKTLAAEVLAGELALDLYRIDLASIVSKYIGETEKNLRRVFDAAEDGGAVLLFDEADALFGKRSEVKDSHDRYANIEVGYLLQRMEAYRGLAILTTNMKSALDSAFLRRLRFVVEFPFPDARQRSEIWRRVFPVATPTEGLDIDKLARLHVSGGSIRNIALGAAFLAAEEGSPVRMTHLLHASRSEFEKLDKPLNETEVRGWVI